MACAQLSCLSSDSKPETTRSGDEKSRSTRVEIAAPVSERRVALVIGNKNYKHLSSLGNPINDATKLAETLRGKAVNFEVQLETDANKKDMEAAIRAFGDNLARGGVGLFYYAGHGVQHNGRNYLVPVDAKSVEADDIQSGSVDVNQVLKKMNVAQNRVNILILDACRDAPSRSTTAGLQTGLAEVKEAPDGTLIAFATAPGQVALDGDGEHSPYTEALLAEIPRPGQSLEGTFKSVRRRVRNNTGKKQIPWENTSLLGDFYFVPPTEARPNPQPTPPEVSAQMLIEDDGPPGPPRIRVLGYEMVRFDPGSFIMGSPVSEGGREDDEERHEVRLNRRFYIGVTEVTQALWLEVMGRNPSVFSACGPTCPVEQVTWLDAVRFANKLSDKENLERCYQIQGETVRWPKGLACKGYRLPTEAEWEYAARAKRNTVYAGANDWRTVAWTAENSEEKTHPVAQKTPNRSQDGLYDMSGNVFEWCWDRYGAYPQDTRADFLGPYSGNNRVVRGGAWDQPPAAARVADRTAGKTSYANNNLGLRLARSD